MDYRSDNLEDDPGNRKWGDGRRDNSHPVSVCLMYGALKKNSTSPYQTRLLSPPWRSSKVRAPTLWGSTALFRTITTLVGFSFFRGFKQSCA